MVALAQKVMPLYMLASYEFLLAMPPSVAAAVMPRSVPMPAPQVMKPMPDMHIAKVLPGQRATVRARPAASPVGGICMPVPSLNM